jgi:DNA primase
MPQDRAWDVAVEDFDITSAAARGGVSLDEYYGEELRADCPFCGDTRQRLGVNSQTKLWHCFNCDEAGNLVGFLMRVLSLTYEAAVEMILAGRNRRRGLPELRAVEHDVPAARATTTTLPAEFEVLKMPMLKRNRRFWRYLIQGRGLSIGLVQDYGIGFARSGEMAWRVIVPVIMHGQLMTFVARAISRERQPKYRSPVGADNSRALFNLERLVGREDVVLVEGVFDALRIPDMAVATLGTHLSQAQRTLLIRAGIQRVILCWDEDDTGLPQAYETARALRGRIEVLQAALPEGADPGHLSVEALRAAIQDARPPAGRGAFRRTEAMARPRI